MKTIIELFDHEVCVEAKESYLTIRRRLFDSSSFIEVTDLIGKVTISKNAIENVTAKDPKRLVQEKGVKKDGKGKNKN